MILPNRFPLSRPLTRALVGVAVVVAVAAAVGVVLVRTARPGLQVSGTVYPVASPTPRATEPTGQRETSTVTCEPGDGGPLRLDTSFTATDGSGRTVRYSISLPDDYYTACKQYPVLYGLHGKTEDNVSFLTDSLAVRRAMAAGVLEQAIIVAPDSFRTGRWEDRETGPAESNLIKELIPYVEQNYRVRPGPQDRLLMGFSMGGHGAFRLGLKYPDQFAAVWSVDGAMADDASYLGLVAGRSTDDFHVIAVGGQLNGDRVKRVVDALRANGITIPYVYQDLEHRFTTFVAEDERNGWPAMTYLQENLGRS